MLNDGLQLIPKEQLMTVGNKHSQKVFFGGGKNALVRNEDLDYVMTYLGYFVFGFLVILCIFLY